MNTWNELIYIRLALSKKIADYCCRHCDFLIAVVAMINYYLCTVIHLGIFLLHAAPLCIDFWPRPVSL